MITKLKNSYGPNDIGIGLAFQPQIGCYCELPHPDLMTENIYNEVLNDKYFLKNRIR